MTADERLVFERITRELEREFGKGSILTADSQPQQCDIISTGVPGIDRALGVGGIPRGRITELYGVESSGKSTLALHIVSECQRNGGVAAYIDAEHALDYGYCASLGIRLDDLLISQPDSGEQALGICESLVRTGEVALVVIDSVASLVPSAELEGEMGQSFVGLQARLMSQAMRKLTAVTSKSNTALIFINQLREKVGIAYGNPEVTPGGRALKFYSTVRMELRRGSAIGKDTEQEGFNCKIKIVKNKLAPPYRTVEVPLMYGKGFDSVTSLVDVALLSGTVLKTGAWYSWMDKKFQGMPSLVEYLKSNPEEMEILKNGL